MGINLADQDSSYSHTGSQALRLSGSQSLSQSVSQSVSGSLTRWLTQSVAQSLTQSVSDSVSKSVRLTGANVGGDGTTSNIISEVSLRLSTFIESRSCQFKVPPTSELREISLLALTLPESRQQVDADRRTDRQTDGRIRAASRSYKYLVRSN